MLNRVACIPSKEFPRNREQHCEEEAKNKNNRPIDDQEERRYEQMNPVEDHVGGGGGTSRPRRRRSYHGNVYNDNHDDDVLPSSKRFHGSSHIENFAVASRPQPSCERTRTTTSHGSSQKVASSDDHVGRSVVAKHFPSVPSSEGTLGVVPSSLHGRKVVDDGEALGWTLHGSQKVVTDVVPPPSTFIVNQSSSTTISSDHHRPQVHPFNNSSSCASPSDITTEYMAESSKSSCFDDACTLSLDPPSGGATIGGGGGGGGGAAAAGESGGSTSELHKTAALEEDHRAVAGCDLPEREERRDEHDGRIRMTTLLMSKGEESKGDSPAPVTINTAKNNNNNGGEDWLQLGLGPHRTATARPSLASASAAAAFEATKNDDGDDGDDDDDEEVDASSSMLRLFPAKSEYHGNKLTAATAAPQWDTADSSSTLYHQGVTRLRQEHDEDAGYLRSSRHQQQQYGAGPELMLSYTNMPVAFTTSTSVDVAEHRLLPELVPQGYGFDVPGYHGDRQEIFGGGRGFAPPRPGGGRVQEPWKQLESTFPQNRPAFYVPAATVPPPPPVLPPYTNTSGSRMSQAEEWQALVKRLHLQSLYRDSHSVDHVEVRGPPSSNLQDLQAQWNSQDSGPARWSNRPYGVGEVSSGNNAKRMPFSLEAALGSRIGPPNPQGWQRSGMQLPYLPIPPPIPVPPQQQQQQQQLHHSGAESSSKEHKASAATGRDHDIWFFLRAAGARSSQQQQQHTVQDSEQLPQILKGYLRVKDGTVPVSHVKKYLAHKLGLLCESEVEISCRGQILMPSLSLQHVRDVIWYSTGGGSARGGGVGGGGGGGGDEDVEAGSTTTTTSSSAHSAASDIVMELTYKRSQPQFGGNKK